MAGGLGKRMALPTEKPLLTLLNKPLVDWVAEAVAGATRVSEFYVVTSVNTPKTEQHCRDHGWRALRTDAIGYHEDLKQAVSLLGWMGPILTLPADVPAITGKVLDRVVDEFEGCGKDFLAVFAPIKARQDLGLSISSTDEYKGEWYAVSGINIVNGAKIQDEGKIETSAIISNETEVILNINTFEDLEIAEAIMKKQRDYSI